MAALLDRIHASRTRPVCVELLNEAAVRALQAPGPTPLPEAPWLIIVGFEDNRDAVAWQVRQLITELPAGHRPAVHAWTGWTADWLWHALTEFPALPGVPLTFKANLLPRATPAFCRQAADLAGDVLLQAHAGNGIVIGQIPGNLKLAQVQAILGPLADAAAAAQGNLILPRCPPAWKAALPVWGRPRGDGWLMRRVKESLDPRRLFNPGRFVDGL